jgi:hypothetical protein
MECRVLIRDQSLTVIDKNRWKIELKSFSFLCILSLVLNIKMVCYSDPRCTWIELLGLLNKGERKTWAEIHK